MGTILDYLIGFMFIVIGCFYNRKHYEKFNASAGSSTGSIIGDLFTAIFVFLLGIMPWFVVNILSLVIGVILIFLIYIS